MVTEKTEYALQAPNGAILAHTGRLPKIEQMQWWTEAHSEVQRLRDTLTDAVLEMGLPLPGYTIMVRRTTVAVTGPEPLVNPER